MERPNRKGRPKNKLIENSGSINEEDLHEVEIAHATSVKATKDKKLQTTTKESRVDPRKNYDPQHLELSRKCGRILDKVKSQKSANFFIQTHDGSPNLSIIEKKLYAFYYTTFLQFATDIRRVWKHQFLLMKSPEIYQKALEACQYFEEAVYAEESPPPEKPQKAAVTVKEEKQKQQPKVKKHIDKPNPVIEPKITNIFEKPFTAHEKNQLGDNIRKLSQPQMKGMLNIVKHHNSTESNSKYFEFDLDTLPTKILRELEVYVRECQSGGKPVNTENKQPSFVANQPNESNNPKPAKIKQVRRPKSKDVNQQKQTFHPKPIKSNTNGNHFYQSSNLQNQRSGDGTSL